MIHPWNVLVACPSYAGKEYALDRFLAAYEAQDYERKHLFMVDNTRSFRGYYDHLLERGVDAARLHPFEEFQETFAACWSAIYGRAKSIGAHYVMSVEADNIIPPETISRFMDLAVVGKLDVVSHIYPLHETAAKASAVETEGRAYLGLGCTLMSMRTVEKALELFPDLKSFELGVWKVCDQYGSYAILQNQLEVEHLDGYEMEYPQFKRPEDLDHDAYEDACPTPRAPAHYGTSVPPSIAEEVVAAGYEGERWFVKNR